MEQAKRGAGGIGGELSLYTSVVLIMLNLPHSREKLEELCRRYHVNKLLVFGSRARGDERPDSDLDLLVEFEAGRTPGWEFFTLERELAKIFQTKVELTTFGGLRE